MSGNRNKTLPEKRDYIRAMLTWFNALTPEINRKLTTAQDISIPDYFEAALVHHIPRLYDSTKEKPGLWPSTDHIHFLGLISLCFSGELSQQTWDAIWKHLPEDKQIFYTTTTYYLGEPLTIAARYGNQSALTRLEQIYQQLLPKHPDRRPHLLRQLSTALFQAIQQPDYDAESYRFLFKMCASYAILIDPNASNKGFSNKKLEYCFIPDQMRYEPEGTPLLDVFANICASGFHARNKQMVLALFRYVHSKGWGQDYEQFKTKFSTLLGDQYPQKRPQKRRETLDHVDKRSPLLERETSETIIEANSSGPPKEEKNSTIELTIQPFKAEPVDTFLSLSKEAAPHSPTIAVPDKAISEALHRFKQAIDNINPKSEVSAKLQDLYDAIQTEEKNIDATAAPYNIIIEHFTEEARQFAKNPHRRPSEIKRSMQKLNLNLYGKQPMSQKVKAAIFAVIGALLGCVIGGVIGAIATGGLGGLPTAILGTTTGFKIGMGVGLGVGLAGGGITGAYSAKKNNFLFFCKEATLNPAIKEKITALSTITGVKAGVCSVK